MPILIHSRQGAPSIYKDYFEADFEKGDVIFYCGSGVTAAFNILLSVYAGYPFPKLRQVHGVSGSLISNGQ
jgi:hypothetical protein